MRASLGGKVEMKREESKSLLGSKRKMSMFRIDVLLPTMSNPCLEI
jgi:hypothetical protein